MYFERNGKHGLVEKLLYKQLNNTEIKGQICK